MPSQFHRLTWKSGIVIFCWFYEMSGFSQAWTYNSIDESSQKFQKLISGLNVSELLNRPNSISTFIFSINLMIFYQMIWVHRIYIFKQDWTCSDFKTAIYEQNLKPSNLITLKSFTMQWNQSFWKRSSKFSKTYFVVMDLKIG